jgi:hypothetical protein
MLLLPRAFRNTQRHYWREYDLVTSALPLRWAAAFRRARLRCCRNDPPSIRQRVGLRITGVCSRPPIIGASKVVRS